MSVFRGVFAAGDAVRSCTKYAAFGFGRDEDRPQPVVNEHGMSNERLPWKESHLWSGASRRFNLVLVLFHGTGLCD